MAALNTSVSSGQCERKKTTQLLQSPELIYAAALSEALPLSVALATPQSTPAPALATRIISGGRKSFSAGLLLLVSASANDVPVHP